MNTELGTVQIYKMSTSSCIMQCLEIVQSLEGKSNDERKAWICEYLRRADIPFITQRYATTIYGLGENVIVPSDKKIEIGIGAHFDAVEKSPGANDNASAVAVSLDLLTRLRAEPLATVGVRHFFFDQEEINLVGSQAYLHANGLGNLQGLINMELVGMGDRLALWPFNPGTSTDLAKIVLRCSGVPTFLFPSLHTNNADHLPFLRAGLRDAFTVTCVSDGDLMTAANYFRARVQGVSDEDLFALIHQAPLFAHYHRPTDTSAHLTNAAMAMVSRVLFSTLHEYDKNCACC